MTKKIREKIRKEIVEPEMRKKMDEVVGKITSADHEKKRASIEFTDPISGSKKNFDKVPVNINTQEGFCGQYLKEGDKVIIGFDNGELRRPIIMNKVIEDGEKHTKSKYTTEKGVYTSNVYGLF